VSLRNATVSSTYVARLSTRSRACVATSVPIAVTRRPKPAKTATSSATVAAPRGHRRRCRALTAGSRAKARKTETSSKSRKLESRWKTARAASAARNPTQNTAIARGTQRGMASRGPGSLGIASSVLVRTVRDRASADVTISP